MNFSHASTVAIFLAIIISCQSEDLENETPSLDVGFVQGNEGKVYSISCLRANRDGILLAQSIERSRLAVAECLTPQFPVAKRAFYGRLPGYAYYPPAYGQQAPEQWDFWAGIFQIQSSPQQALQPQQASYGGQQDPGYSSPSASSYGGIPPQWSNYMQQNTSSNTYNNQFNLNNIYNLFGYSQNSQPSYVEYFDNCVDACFQVGRKPRKCARRRCLSAVYPVY